MRHQVFGRHLNRDVKERKALYKSLINALIQHGRIKTTLAKAKAIKGLAEKLVTRAKENSVSAFSQLSSFLTKKDIINKLFKEIAPRFQNKLGGYLRMVRLGRRAGDNAQEVMLEWTVKEEKKEKPKEKAKK